jgi:hypothetical protein
MSSPPAVEALQKTAREVFGRELSGALVEAARGRLATMVQNVQTLRRFEPALGTTDMALIQRVVGDGRHD